MCNLNQNIYWFHENQTNFQILHALRKEDFSVNLFYLPNLSFLIFYFTVLLYYFTFLYHQTTFPDLLFLCISYTYTFIFPLIVQLEQAFHLIIQQSAQIFFQDCCQIQQMYLIFFGLVKAQQKPAFKLSSPEITNGTFAYKHWLNGFNCKGGNLSPQLVIQNPPLGTKSYCLLLIDVDVPITGFVHWALCNIPSTTTKLASGVGQDIANLPAGTVVVPTDFNTLGVTSTGGYGGPCAPVNHKFVFHLFAMSVDNIYTASGMPPTSTSGAVSFVVSIGIKDKQLANTTLTVYSNYVYGQWVACALTAVLAVML